MSLIEEWQRLAESLKGDKATVRDPENRAFLSGTIAATETCAEQLAARLDKIRLLYSGTKRIKDAHTARMAAGKLLTPTQAREYADADRELVAYAAVLKALEIEP